MSRLSASGLHRAIVCPASVVLPGAERLFEDATRGSAIHAYLEDVPRLGAAAARAKVPEEYLALVDAIDLDQLPEVTPGSYGAEVQLGYDVLTGEARELGRGTGREYATLRETEVPGTADIVGLTADAVVVGDYKTGWGGKVAPAWKNLQIRFLALAGARAWGRSKAVTQLIRIRDDGSVWRDFATFDALALDETAVEVRSLVRQVAQARADYADGKQLTVRLGDHCWRCPARLRCPGQTQLAMAVGTPGGLEAEFVNVQLTHETAARAWQRIKQVEDLVELVKKAIKDLARDQPVKLGNGLVLGARPTEKEQLDAAVTWQVVADLHGDKVADEAVPMAASKAGVERALKGIAKKGQLAGLKRAVLEEIDKRKGITVKTGVTVDEHEEAA